VLVCVDQKKRRQAGEERDEFRLPPGTGLQEHRFQLRAYRADLNSIPLRNLGETQAVARADASLA